jgi:hypothetical protein
VAAQWISLYLNAKLSQNYLIKMLEEVHTNKLVDMVVTPGAMEEEAKVDTVANKAVDTVANKAVVTKHVKAKVDMEAEVEDNNNNKDPEIKMLLCSLETFHTKPTIESYKQCSVVEVLTLQVLEFYMTIPEDQKDQLSLISTLPKTPKKHVPLMVNQLVQHQDL